MNDRTKKASNNSKTGSRIWWVCWTRWERLIPSQDRIRRITKRTSKGMVVCRVKIVVWCHHTAYILLAVTTLITGIKVVLIRNPTMHANNSKPQG